MSSEADEALIFWFFCIKAKEREKIQTNEMMMEKKNDIELRSEEVQEVMGEIPSWIIRWGITLLTAVVLTLVIGSCFFRYPDVISTRMTLTSHEPVAQLVARSSGKISRLYVADGEPVYREQLLVVLENPAKTDDVLLLERELHAYAGLPDSLTERLLPLKELALGDIRSTYSTLLSDLHAYRNYRELDYYPQKIGSTESQLRKHRTYYALLQRQQQITADQYRLAWQQYERDSLLYIQQVLSAYEHETARSTYLQSRYSLESANASLETERIQIGQLEESLLDLRLEQMPLCTDSRKGELHDLLEREPVYSFGRHSLHHRPGEPEPADGQGTAPGGTVGQGEGGATGNHPFLQLSGRGVRYSGGARSFGLLSSGRE